MAFYGELFRKKDEEDIWEELKRMLRNPPTEEEIALKKQQEQAKIDEAISRMFPDEPEPAKEPYLTSEELLSPQDAERYRQKQMVQNNLNASGGEPTGFAAPITQNKQGGLIGNTKVQQMFNKPTNLVNQNNNLVQGLGNSLTQGTNSLKKQNTFPNLNKTSDLSSNSKLVSKKNKKDGLKTSNSRVINNSNIGFGKNSVLATEAGGININNEDALPNLIERCYNDYKNYEDPASAIGYAIGSFLTNFLEMKNADTHGADKYFHARANYDSAQQGPISELTAKIISDIREFSDADRNIREKKYSPEFSQRDIDEDQKANEEGRRLGRMFPNIPAYEKLKHRMPKGFPLRYRYK